MAQDRDEDRTDCKRPSSPLLCANNCGFFGCPATMNLCSKCYKASFLDKESSLSVQALGEKLSTLAGKEAGNEAISVAALKIGAEEGKMESISSSTFFISGKGSQPSTAAHSSVRILETPELAPIAIDELQGSNSAVAPALASERPNTGTVRCLSCKKKVGLLSFKCRCGGLFCSSHRYSDKHECTFDYKAAARDVITKNNPVVKAEKVQKI